MKKYLLVLTISFSGLISMAQNVGINATGAQPDPSAMLDVSAFNKGILVPRTSTVSRTAIVSPAKGLMVYDTTTSSFWFHDGTDWNEIPKGSGGGGNNWSASGNNIYNTNTGFVGVGTNAPTEPLTVVTADLQRGFSHHGANGKILSSFMGDTYAEFATLQNTDLYLGAGGFPHVILRSDNGNVGINYSHPTNVLQVGYPDSNNYNGYQFAFGNGTNGSGFYQSNQTLWTSSTNMHIVPKFTALGSGTLGINTYEETNNKLQIGSLGSSGYNGNDIAFGNSGQAAALAQTSSIMQVASTTDMNLVPQNGTGHVGINSNYPISNKLQIGSPAGFAGNDITIGNSGQVTGITQTANILQIASTTDVSFLPQYGTNHGRVGINTASPLAPLDVASYYNIAPLSPGYSFIAEFSLDGNHGSTSFFYSPTVVDAVSIVSQGNVYCSELDAFSDLRIKNLIGTSDPVKDLESLKSIRIRDYTMKDKLKYGNRHFKKVIAQELEKVYPELVSKHTNFIPNVYQLTDSVTRVAGGYRLHFAHDHHLGDSAKALKALLTETGSLEALDIVSIPSPREVIIKAGEIKNSRVFVYGERVDDFRTVDYEGLTTLNISATQEIGRLVSTQAETISNQQKEIDLLSARLSALEKPSHPPKTRPNKGGALASIAKK